MTIEEASRDFMLAAHRTSTLYELSADWAHLVDLLEDPNANTEVIEAELTRLGEHVGHKAENIAGLIKWCEGLAAMRKAEARRMADGADLWERKAAGLRAYVLRHMLAMDMNRIDTSRFTLSVRVNPPHVEILEPMLVPHEFQREKITIEPDKKAILEHAKQTGEVVPGAEIVRDKRLDIR